MEGSHLCHHGNCIVPAHSTYEDAAANRDRESCHSTAQEMRALGLSVPKGCASHSTRPCLLQVGLELHLLIFANKMPAGVTDRL